VLKRRERRHSAKIAGRQSNAELRHCGTILFIGRIVNPSGTP